MSTTSGDSERVSSTASSMGLAPAAMLAGSHADALALPPPYAIAHHLVRLFVEESAKGLT